MTSHTEDYTVATPDGSRLSDPETNANMAGTGNTVRYTQDELIKLKPAPMSPVGSLQSVVQAPDEAVTQASISVETAATVADIKPETEQLSELGGKPTAVTIEENEDGQEPNDKLNLKKRPSIAEWMEGDNGETVQPVEDNWKVPDDATAVVGEAAKKKKKKKSSGRKKKPNPTGFEEFYADTPITPEEHAEEVEELYHFARPFAERIETCVQRYRARRKFDEERANIFNKYLSLGGIDTTIKAFTGGVDNEALEDYDAPTITDIHATDVMFSGDDIGSKFYDPCAPHNWVVDFEGIAKAFLSYRAPYIFGIHRQSLINKYCDVVKNFLNYVLMHGVCPEYTKDIIAAQKVCELARTELAAIHSIANTFPGNYHKALSIICDGYASTLYVDPATIPNLPADADPNYYMSREHAHRTFRAAVALMGTETQFATIAKLEVGEAPEVVAEELRGFEVIRITPPTEEIRQSFAGIRAADGRIGTIMPLGHLDCKPWVHPCQDTLDLTPSEELERLANLPVHHNETFWIDDDVLEKCFLGMKFIAVIRELAGGMKYIDHLRVVYASFYAWVENERMLGWRVPRENERMAPCCEDEEVADGEGEGEEGGDD